MRKCASPILIPCVSVWGMGTTRDAIPSATRSRPAYSSTFISSHRSIGKLVVQNDTQQRAVNLQPAFRPTRVIDKTQFPEPVHEEAHPRTSRAHPLGQTLLTDLRNHRLRHPFLPNMSDQKKDPGQPLFTG